jgi:hypothetical protein
MDSGDVIAAGVREAAQRAGGTVTRERYAVLVFEREAPLRGGQGVPGDTDPQALAVSRSTATAGEAAAAEALNGVIGASGEYRLVSSSVRPA